MKIAIVVIQFPPIWVGGTEIATLNLAKYLTKKGHEVHILTKNKKGIPTNNCEYSFKIHRFEITENRFLKFFDFWIKIFFALKYINPDIIHFQDIFIAIPSFIIKKLLRKPIVLYGRGSDVYHYGNYKFCRFLYKLNLKSADAVVALTENMKNNLLNIYNRKISVVPNGIDLEKFVKYQKNIPEKTEIQRIIYVGGLRQIKGIKYLIRAFKIVKNQKKDLKLIIIGEGNEKESLETLIETIDLNDSVIFTGKLDNEKIPKNLVQSDIFVLPSISEGFPNVILEAMAVGLPIIATNTTGMNEIINDFENGFLVEIRDPQLIADNLLRIINDKKLYSDISRNNLKKINQYDLNNVLSQIEDIYVNLLNDV